MWCTSHGSGGGRSHQARNSGKFYLPLAGLFALTLVPMLGKQKELSQSEENHPKGPGEQVTGNEASDQRHGVPVAHVI